MKVLEPGVSYELASHDGGAPQTLRFLKSGPVAAGSPALKTVTDGTTNEELLAVLLNRMYFLQAKSPCRENSIVITHLEDAENWLHRRTASRKARGVEGTSTK